MKIRELMGQLEFAAQQHGDVECLVEVIIEDCVALMPVDELNFEYRDGFGESITLIC